ncbi:MAG: molybdopterin-guanine dinucleotide biosynthesis protein B [Planctomycetota bacterium]|jgi:molybdopterin-guanine dinucleotide biosynthesis protein B
MLDSLPVFGVCGWSGSGKTTLIEQLVPELAARGLRVAVVKHDAHGLDIDREGKDSDRLFRAGADVLMRGPGQMFFRGHDRSCLEAVCASLARSYDVILVEGHKGTPLPKMWLLGGREGGAPPPEVTDVRACLPRDAGAALAPPPGATRGRVRAAMSVLDRWLPRRWLQTPVYGCVLGGRDSTSGAPVEVKAVPPSLSRVVERTVIAGPGASGAGEWDCIPLAPDATERGFAGLLAAMRWQPHVSWIAVEQTSPPPSGCELRQLLLARRPGVWAATPAPDRDAPRQGPAPLYVDFRAGATVEALATKGATRGPHFNQEAAEVIAGGLAPGIDEEHHIEDGNSNRGLQGAVARGDPGHGRLPFPGSHAAGRTRDHRPATGEH